VIAVEEDVDLDVGRRRHRFERVPHERCLACGERIFGIDASQRFDAVALRRRSSVPTGRAPKPGAGAALHARGGRAR
jgi:hypothetical protein